jgi:hypothetical protein
MPICVCGGMWWDVVGCTVEPMSVGYMIDPPCLVFNLSPKRHVTVTNYKSNYKKHVMHFGNVQSCGPRLPSPDADDDNYEHSCILSPSAFRDEVVDRFKKGEISECLPLDEEWQDVWAHRTPLERKYSTKRKENLVKWKKLRVENVNLKAKGRGGGRKTKPKQDGKKRTEGT